MSAAAADYPNAGGADAAAARARTRRTMAASVLLHLGLVLWLVTRPPAAASVGALTEIEVLDAGDGTPAAAAAPAAGGARIVTPGVSASDDAEERFRRETHRADVAPGPQSADAFDDLVRERLAALPGRTDVAPSAGGSAPVMMPAGYTGEVPGGTGPALALRRGGEGTGTALALTRGPADTAPVAALAPATHVANAPAASPAAGGDMGARRQLAGASLAGPIADRAVLHSETPAYPEWAKREAVEGAVRLYFVVRADGTIRENVLVQKTAGFADFDESAMHALLAWRFAPLPAGRAGEQWGTITFRFRLRGADGEGSR